MCTFRRPFFERQPSRAPLAEATQNLLRSAIEERLKRFRELAEKMETSVRGGAAFYGVDSPILLRQRELTDRWSDLEVCFRSGIEETAGIGDRDGFLEMLQGQMTDDYIRVIRQLPAEAKVCGTGWLQAIVTEIVQRAGDVLPRCCNPND